MKANKESIEYGHGTFYVRPAPSERYVSHTYATTAERTARAIYDALSRYLGNKYDRPSNYKRTVRIVRSYDSAIAIRLYDTDVLTFYSDGSFSMRTEGWNTQQTRETIDTFAPSVRGIRVGVTSIGGQAFVRFGQYGPSRYLEWMTGYHDRVHFGPRGKMTSTAIRQTFDNYTDAARYMNRQAYARRKAEKIARQERDVEYAIQRLRERTRSALDQRIADDIATARHHDKFAQDDYLRQLATDAEREYYDSVERDLPAGYLCKYLMGTADEPMSNWDGSRWSVGAWRHEPERFDGRLCNGLNASNTPQDAAGYVGHGSVFAFVEVAGRSAAGPRKSTHESMRIVAAWNVTNATNGDYLTAWHERTPDAGTITIGAID